MQLIKTVVVLSAIVGSLLTNAPQLSAADLLTIGSDAPKLDVEHWVQDGKGKFKPVTDFQPGKVYVVEFWATWCGPCIASMPHLAALQGEYANRGVQIVSISDEDLETVEKFLKREVPNRSGGPEPEEGKPEEVQTYKDLTSAYCLTTDPDQSSYQDYMVAAEQNGIPTAFIVGKDAKVEWIGHPMEMDEPLAAVVNDSWDRAAFAESMRARQMAEKALNDIYAALQSQDFDVALKLIDETFASVDEGMQQQLMMMKLQVLIQKNDVEAALKFIDELMAKSPEQEQFKMLKLQVLIVAKQIEAANTLLGEIFTEVDDQPQAVNAIAWNIYEMAAQGQLEKGALIASALAAATKAADKVPAEEKWSVLDTVAHLAFVNGDIDQAIATELEAKKLAKSPEDREFIEDFLAELEKAKKASQAQDTGDIAK